MNYMAGKNVNGLLREGSGHSQLQKLLRHNANQKAWTDQLRAALDGGLKNHVQVSDLRGSRLTLICSSAGIATKVRFAAPELIAKLADLSAFCQVEEILLTVQSDSSSDAAAGR